MKSKTTEQKLKKQLTGKPDATNQELFKGFKQAMSGICYGFINWKLEIPRYIERAKKLKAGANLADYFQALYNVVIKTETLFPDEKRLENYFSQVCPPFWIVLSESIHCLGDYERWQKEDEEK